MKRRTHLPKIHCRACNHLFFAGNGTQRCCSTSCESALTNRFRVAVAAAKKRRITKKAT